MAEAASDHQTIQRERPRHHGKNPRIYYAHPWLADPRDWPEVVAEAAELGFTHLLLGWPFGSAEDLLATNSLDAFAGEDAGEALERLARLCAEAGLQLWLDLAVARVSAKGELAAQVREFYAPAVARALDPRTISSTDTLEAAAEHPQFAAFWGRRLLDWQARGVSGVRCHEGNAIPLHVWKAILAPARGAGRSFEAFGWLPEVPRGSKVAAAEIFDFLPSSVAWWSGSETWLMEEYDALAPLCRLIGFPSDPFATRSPARSPLDASRERELLVADAALLADGWMMPMGFEFGLDTPFASARREDDRAARQGGLDRRPAIRATNAEAASFESQRARYPRQRPLLLAKDRSVVLRKAGTGAGHLVQINRDPINLAEPAWRERAAAVDAAPGDGTSSDALPPASGQVMPLVAARPGEPDGAVPIAGRPELAAARIAIENVRPMIDGGRFPVKRRMGDSVAVTADIFSDGHDVLEAALLWRPAGPGEWTRAAMHHVVNDRWEGEFPLLDIGRHDFAIEAWWSEFGTFRRDFAKKQAAGLDLTLEVAEGRLLLDKFLATAAGGSRAVLQDNLSRLGGNPEESAALLLSQELAAAMAASDPKQHATGSETVYHVEADREAAAFSSWYELFPRSITDTPHRHGTFRDVAGRLPAIREMGFDVLYFPPIHPIGKTNRKGRNNTLTPAPDDPGSPYAIGSPDGGHDAVHPELGTLDDFRMLVAEAERHGLEIALDFAIQCSPDHPWLKQHPDWFSWRPDGSMRYAENPPKKYQDIVNVDFYGPGAIPDLWLALRDAVQFWIDHGVRIFRVDNPHTKPFPFWEWLIADIRSRDPGVLFLAEAFTRPKVMYRLGKVGFSQSYTYFTWRNTKAEITEYLTELNAAPASEIFRPHFFVNTPDINPVFLQRSGRPGFLIRAALAATLSGLWGVYSGFELCESAAIPGKEEYLDSEKYEIRPRDWQAPGNIVAEITSLNRIRRNHPALQSHLGLSFYNAWDDNILYFGKRAGQRGEMILVAINLDPHAAHEAQIEVPLWEFGLPDHASVAVEDLMLGHRFDWHGKMQAIRLDPQILPFAIWRIVPPEGF
ncbi:alpha-1,4-glucan--maltose-1-phosphate maltosyltransferase [Bosea sp. (in: a-proteobacteria)]|uniref:alpha-1,4-glucan--maltose-1-phosphate maltosyltransferase n=1 Tax=Bosea sp. (in: a-proteobacteria) TaxID=1871050 RepID=UPI0025C4F7DD|nr:alpha-1,4-glucan--maltose-1-phosphate maltosyltransferase [Bosea sp. (in: a-proteobacteria)]